MADKNVSIDITAADRTAAAFASVKRGLGEVDSKIGALKGTFSAFSAIAATIGITDLVKQAVEAASKAEQSSNRLNAVIRATGDTSGFTREQLDKMADSLTKATTFDDEGIRDAQANLMKFGRLHGETFERALKLSADYAAFTGGTMVEATQLIGKALADPVNGATALGKAIGKLSQTEQEAVQSAMEHGRVADAQAVIFAKLERSIGGTSGAMNVGIYGATTAAAKAYDDFLKAIGKSGAVQIAVVGPLGLIAEGINAITEAILKQNKAIEKNPLYTGKLQPLPESPADAQTRLKAMKGYTTKDVQNTPTATPQTFTVPNNALTVEEVAAQGAAARAQQEEAAQARREAAAAREKQRMADIKKADESFWQMANLKLEANDQWNKSVEETRKKTLELEDTQSAANLRYLEGQAQLEIAAAAEGERTLQRRNAEEADKADRIFRGRVMVLDSLRTEREIEDQDYIQKQQILQERFQNDFDNRNFWYVKLWNLDRQYQLRKTQIEDEQIKKRFGIAQVYRKLDLDAALFFSNQLAGLMQTKSRALFEIGKVAAIAGAIIDSYKAATGSYAALAPIPIVGPALGAAAAAAAIAIGFARVAAIKSTTFGSSTGAIGTFSASPVTGLPTETTDNGVQQVAPAQVQTQQRVEKTITLQIIGDGMFSASQIRDSLIPLLNEAVGDGVTLRASTI